MPETIASGQIERFYQDGPALPSPSRNAVEELVRTLVIEYFPKGESS